METLVTRAASDLDAAAQLLTSLTSPSSVTPALLPRILAFLAGASDLPGPARQMAFLAITGECDSGIAPALDAAVTLTTLLTQATASVTSFCDNNALFRCLLSLTSTPSPLLPSSPELDALIIAVCHYHPVVSLEFIDVSLFIFLKFKK
jgi:hypothetical protein